MPPVNIGLSERKVRLVIGLLLMLTSILLLTFNQLHFAIAVFAFALIPLFTSITGTCPFYCAMKKSTNTEQITLESN